MRVLRLHEALFCDLLFQLIMALSLYLLHACSEDFRERVLAQTRDPALVVRLAPRLPGEADAARRGRALYMQLEQALGLRTQPLLQVRAHGLCVDLQALLEVCARAALDF